MKRDSLGKDISQRGNIKPKLFLERDCKYTESSKTELGQDKLSGGRTRVVGTRDTCMGGHSIGRS